MNHACRHSLKTVIIAGALALSAQLSASARDIVPLRGYEAGTAEAIIGRVFETSADLSGRFLQVLGHS